MNFVTVRTTQREVLEDDGEQPTEVDETGDDGIAEGGAEMVTAGNLTSLSACFIAVLKWFQ